jgi:hypothetical protein
MPSLPPLTTFFSRNLKNAVAISTILGHKHTMLSRIFSAAISGTEAYPIEVEVNAGYGDTLVVIVINNTPHLWT